MLHSVRNVRDCFEIGTTIPNETLSGALMMPSRLPPPALAPQALRARAEAMYDDFWDLGSFLIINPHMPHRLMALEPVEQDFDRERFAALRRRLHTVPGLYRATLEVTQQRLAAVDEERQREAPHG